VNESETDWIKASFNISEAMVSRPGAWPNFSFLIAAQTSSCRRVHWYISNQGRQPPETAEHQVHNRELSRDDLRLQRNAMST